MSLITLRKSGIWQTSQSSRTASGLVAAARDLGQLRQRAQRQMIVGLARRYEAADRCGPLIEALQQPPTERKSSRALRQIEPRQRIEAVVLDRLDDLGIEPAQLGGRAEGAVAHVAAGAAGDLRDLRRREAPRRPAVELHEPGEGDMVEIHVEAHADRVGRDQVIDLARLEEPDLRVAGARAQAPSTTAVPPRWRRISSASAKTSATAKATTALRGGRRVTFFGPV